MGLHWSSSLFSVSKKVTWSPEYGVSPGLTMATNIYDIGLDPLPSRPESENSFSFFIFKDLFVII